MVRSGLVTACRLASWPTRRSPLLLSNATTEGVVRSPSELEITTGSPPSKTATQLFVVPRSIPMLLVMYLSSRGDRGLRLQQYLARWLPCSISTPTLRLEPFQV